VRIARFVRLEGGTTAGQNPRYGLVEGDPGAETLAVLTGDPLYPPVQVTGEQIPLSDVRLLAPVIPRSKVIGIGRNYADHAAELGNEPPAEPLIFLKPNTSVIGPDDPVFRPRISSEVHYEGELAVVIGRLCRDVPPDRTDAVVLGYTCGNDVTARDLQRSDPQWTRAKGFDSFCPLGPWIVDDLDVRDLEVRCEVGRDPDAMELRQLGRTKDMIFDVPTLVSYVSHVMTLLPGDVILTGTPAGVGPIQSGETVSVGIQGIGELANPVVSLE
jgi:2-keto-4-pentenoate hydratase/2-oxohepta-3-ene-1,7-dioic acid hydratase in catechol pathway